MIGSLHHPTKAVMARVSKLGRALTRLLAGWLSGLVLFSSATASAEAGPNIIFLLSDDQRADTLGCMGNAIVQTPNLDRMAGEGVLFERHFVTTAICAVSRASILSGQYARRHGIHDFAGGFRPEAWLQTYPALLRAAGYRTGFIGKYGVGSEMPEAGFDYWDGFAGQGYYFPPDGKGPRHLTPLQAESAVRFLESNPPGRPFCLSISFKAPHVQDGAEGQPFHFDPGLAGLYADVTIPPPPKAGLYDGLPDFLKHGENRARWEKWYAPEELRQASVKGYLRLVSGIDQAVGEIRAALDRLGLAGETVIIYTSDNGMMQGERGLAEKWLMYEESIRVPLIIYDPRLEPAERGRRIMAMTLSIDLAPTMLELAGAAIPAAMQGRSLVPWVKDGGLRGRSRGEWFYEHLYEHGGRIAATEGVRTDRWKYIRYIKTEPVREELYDLRDDPGEMRDLASDPAHADELAGLRERWRVLRVELE